MSAVRALSFSKDEIGRRGRDGLLFSLLAPAAGANKFRDAGNHCETPITRWSWLEFRLGRVMQCDFLADQPFQVGALVF